MSALVDLIAAHLATWDTPHVELAAFGTGDPHAIARAIDDACARVLGARVASARFYASSIAAVAGVVLDDARAVVVKVHQPDVAVAQLVAIARLRAHLPFAPRVLGDPIALVGGAHATIEELVDGARRDAREPATRRALAAGLHAIVTAARPHVATAELDGALAPPPDRLWPTPHSKLFDFEATRAGADHIDDVARAARDVIAPAGELVVAHADWRAEHVRFAPDEPRIVVAYDWDLRRDREPAIVGGAAHGFTADWSDENDRAQAPSLDDARGFVADYEAARGRAFDRDERRLCGATFAYACAYTARCGHALGIDDRAAPGTFGALVASHGARLLAL
jgi:hypothetical protein